MSSPKTRQRKLVRNRASILAKNAADALSTLIEFIENNDECMDAAEATYSGELDILEDAEDECRKLTKSFAGEEV